MAAVFGALPTTVQGVVSQVTGAVGEATLLANNPQYAPIAVQVITASVDGVLTTIPVVGGTLATGVNQVVGTITSVAAPGETVLIPIIGSVTAVVNGVTQTVDVIAPTSALTGLVGTVTSLVGSVVGSVTGGLLPTVTGMLTSTPSLPVGGSGNLPTTSLLNGGGVSGVPTSTPTIPLFSNAAMVMVAPQNQFTGMIAIFVMIMTLMFSSGAMMIFN